jgi:hypothetical protein
MISLEKLLKELNVVMDNPDGSIRTGYNNVFALKKALGPSLVKIVISDEKNGGFHDAKKRNELFSLIKSTLNRYDTVVKSSIKNNKSEIQKIMDGIKYYPATGKIVGNLPKFMFKLGNVPSMRSILISKEIAEISDTIEIKQKK